MGKLGKLGRPSWASENTFMILAGLAGIMIDFSPIVAIMGVDEGEKRKRK